MKRLQLIIGVLFATTYISAQSIQTVPTMSPAGGQHDDNVLVHCTTPVGCAGLCYWFDGAEILRTAYTSDILVETTSNLSIAGVNSEGRIITDIVTHHFDIRKVTAPWASVTPPEGVRNQSFYVTKLLWNNATRVDLDLSAFKEDGSRYGEPVIWLTNADQRIISYNDYNGLWVDGYNTYKAYIYKNYNIDLLGHYQLHIAGGIFIVDGTRYEQELQFDYEIAAESQTPTFTPAPGEYTAPLEISINYPSDGSAFYRYYKLNGAKAKSYTGPIIIDEPAETITIEAYGLDEFFTTETPRATATYTVVAPQPIPEPLPSPEIHREGNTITLSQPTADAVIQYWLNDCLATSQIYTAPFQVTQNGRVSCITYTADRQSEVVNLDINDFVVDRGDMGDQILLTPYGLEDLHVVTLSPNARYAVGYTGEGEDSRGFIWDIPADRFWYPTPGYINQLLDIQDDGTAYGWCVRTTDLDQQIGDDIYFWGTCKDGVWTELSGPRPQSDTIYSPNRMWAVVAQHYRLDLTTGHIDTLVSTSHKYHNPTPPEVITSIANDGTIFGTYDASLTNQDKGLAIVYTTDGRWRTAADWLRDVKGFVVPRYDLTSVRAVAGDHNQLLMHVFPAQVSPDDAFSRGMMLRLNVQVRHLTPAYLHAEQMQGAEIVKIEWKAPISGADELTSYTLWRDGEQIATLTADQTVYYDREVSADHTYSYALTATYNDGIVSSMSDAAQVTVVLYSHLPVRGLTSRQVGFNSVQLSWQAPLTTMPKLQYFDEQGEFSAFGSTYDSEWGVRIPASDIDVYQDKQIRTFQFMPTGRQMGYEIRLYRCSAGGVCEPQPFYTQTIDPNELIYGTTNTILLREPQSVPAGTDLIAAIYIISSGNYDMFGVQYDAYRAGYTDLCHIIEAWDGFATMSDLDPDTRIVLPIGIGLCSESELGGLLVTHYLVSELTDSANEHDIKHLIANAAEGEHTYSVVAVYQDGESSPATSIDVTVTNQYVAAQPLSIQVHANQSATIDWQCPMDDDRTHIHYGDMTPSEGLYVPSDVNDYTVSAVYPATMTLPYTTDYEIIGAYFYPTASAELFTAMIYDGVNYEPMTWASAQSLELNALNYIYFDQPLQVNSSIEYRLSINIYHPEAETAPLAYDSSNRWQDGMSNLISIGAMELTLSEFVQIDEHPNWLIGLLIRRRDAQPMPIRGYTLRIDDEPVTTELVTDTRYVTGTLTTGQHTAAIDATYINGHIEQGAPHAFVVGTEDITSTTADSPLMQGCYDLLGRRVTYDAAGRGVWIIDGKKIIQ